MDKYSYELYGGPLDGAVKFMPRSLAEGERVEFDLSVMVSSRGKLASASVIGVAQYVVVNGRLTFSFQR